MLVRYRILLASFLILFFGCADEQISLYNEKKCLSDSSVKITTVLPAGKVDMGSPSAFQNPSEQQIIESYGIYVEKNAVLTVFHAFPKSAQISGFTKIFSDEEKELLLLSAEKCGIPTPVSRDSLLVDTELFDCDSGEKIGTITKTNVTSYSQLPFSFSTKPLQNISVLPGDFLAGNSGRGFCRANGTLAGILVATDSNRSGLLIPAEVIVEFLN